MPKQALTRKQSYEGQEDFYDMRYGTMQKDQNDLSLKTVQKMFAGRKEHH